MKYQLLGWLLFCSSVAIAQTKEIQISGTAICDEDSISNITVKAEWKKAGYIVAYSKADKKGSFSFSAPFSKPDTLIIHFSRTGYHHLVKELFVDRSQAMELSVVLTASIKELDTARIKAPPMWRRGDTTFFRVDAYTNGYEQKLIEAVRNMPGLELTPDGELLFKHKRIEKILVEGQELFADQVKMLLSNVPLHIVKYVQLLENQSEDTLLNGLGAGNKVFMNLQLKEGVKWQFIFGDACGGLGTLNRYLLNPVLFSIRGKIKTGIISNLNNTGDIPGYGELRQLKGYTHYNLEAWPIHANRIHSLPLFNSTSYLQNQMFNNQLQLNYEIGPKLKAESSLSFYADRQQQQIITNAELIEKDSFFARNELRQMRYQPGLWQAKQKMEINVNPTTKWAIDAVLLYDGSKARSASLYSYAGKTEENIEKFKQSFWSGLLETRYTRRISSSRAIEWTQKLSYQHLPQQITGVSPSWNEIFNIDSPSYQKLRLNYASRISNLESTIHWTTKKKDKLQKQSLLLSAEWNSLEIAQWLMPQTAGTNSENYWLRNQQAQYAKATVDYAKHGSIPLGNPYKIDWNAKSGLGFASLLEPGRQFNRLAPQVEAEAGIKNRRSLGRLPELSVNVSHALDRMYRYPGIPIPRQLISYQANRSSPQPITKLDIWFDMGNKLFYKRLNWFILVNYHTQLQSYAYANHYQQFLLVAIDSLLPKSSQSLSGTARINYIFDVYKPSDEAAFEVGYNIYQYWINTGKGFSAIWMKSFTPRLVFNHAFTKWMHTEANGLLQASYFGNDADITSQKSWRYNCYAQLKAQIGIGKQSNLLINAEWGINDWQGATENRLLFCNALYSYKWPNRRFTIQLHLNNVFNQRTYSTLNNTPSSRYYTQIPLTGRNMFISCRYEL